MRYLILILAVLVAGCEESHKVYKDTPSELRGIVHQRSDGWRAVYWSKDSDWWNSKIFSSRDDAQQWLNERKDAGDLLERDAAVCHSDPDGESVTLDGRTYASSWTTYTIRPPYWLAEFKDDDEAICNLQSRVKKLESQVEQLQKRIIVDAMCGRKPVEKATPPPPRKGRFQSIY